MKYVPRHRSYRSNAHRNDGGQPRQVKTVAFLSSSPGGRFNLEKWLMWRGVAEAARDYGFNLVYLSGEEFETSPQSVLYELVSSHNADGIIICHPYASQRSTLDRVQEFVESFEPLPVVNLGVSIKGSVNLLFNEEQGVRELLAHLIQEHGYQKIAFARREAYHAAAFRQQAFEQAMNEYGLYDPSLVGCLEELKGRGVLEHKQCQAILAYSDDLAVEIIDDLRESGLKVPEDIVVTGFNDGQEARGSLPPLTTVRLPFRNLGRKAIELLDRLMGRETIEEADMLLDPHLILRRSCGCLEPMAEQAAGRPVPPSLISLQEQLLAVRDILPISMAPNMGISIESLSLAWAEELLNLFLEEFEQHLVDPEGYRPSRKYLRNLSDLLQVAVSEGSNVTRWHDALTAMRQELLPNLSAEDRAFAEDLWHQARVLIGQVAVRSEVHRNWYAARRTEILHEIEADLLIAFEFNELLDILTRGLTRLGLKNFYLVLYEGPFQPDGMARLALAYQNGARVPLEPGEQRFLVQDLLPARWLISTRPYCLVIEALHLGDEQLGYLVFRADPPADAQECDVYQALRVQLSSALKGIRLRQGLHDARQQAEEANLLKSRFLSMVSHELRTPLNLIVGLSEMALRQQERSKEDPLNNLAQLQKFLEQIYVSGQHLDRLIRDVLDLASSQAGQMTLITHPLELLPIIQDVASMGEHLAQQKNLDFRVDVPAYLPMVNGDKTRLRQILLNLLSNAVKFTAHGEIVIKVTHEADEITISVSDTGLGVEKEDQDKIFDEFRQSDRSVARGYGGIGLGLAITRRLVEMHGGRIWVTSTGSEGSGSTFSFTLPVLHETEESKTAEPEEPDSSRAGVVLIITSEKGGSRSLADYLMQHNFQVEELALQDAPEFSGALLQSPPGAVVLDLAPAAEQGWDIMKRIKENPSTQDIPVLFYSLIQEEGTGAMLEMDYLSKPVGSSDLVQALRRHGLEKSPNGKKRTILIVDDEPGIIDLHTRIVKSELPGCGILSARNGQEGLHIMRHKIPDLVLLDLMMPELDGFAVLKAMQSEEMLRNVPVIVLSGQTLSRREMDRLNQGVAAVLNKGMFSSKEILVKIEDALARNKRLGSESQRLVQQAMAFIHEHYKEPISRSDIANHLSINEQYLSRCFNKELGIGPMVYLSRFRIQSAKRLLEAGSLSITQVAMEVGMSSQSYFSRVFQEETGVTPSAYQRGIRPEG